LPAKGKRPLEEKGKRSEHLVEERPKVNQDPLK
jgi:hypothetical protein